MGMGIYGISQNGSYKNLHGDYMNASSAPSAEAAWRRAEEAKGRRNMGYIIGSALLAGGIGVYFFF
jgi:hypothetical protein